VLRFTVIRVCIGMRLFCGVLSRVDRSIGRSVDRLAKLRKCLASKQHNATQNYTKQNMSLAVGGPNYDGK
jgi:hypothetical protein